MPSLSKTLRQHDSAVDVREKRGANTPGGKRSCLSALARLQTRQDLFTWLSLLKGTGLTMSMQQAPEKHGCNCSIQHDSSFVGGMLGAIV